MKSVDQVLADVERRLTNTWASCLVHASATQSGANAPAQLDTQSVTAAAPDRGTLTCPWPYPFPLGQPSSASLANDFARAAGWAATWRTWSAARDTSLRTRSRRVLGTEQELPTHLVV